MWIYIITLLHVLLLLLHYKHIDINVTDINVSTGSLVFSLVRYKYLLRSYSKKRNRCLISKIFYNLLTYDSREIRFNSLVRVRVLLIVYNLLPDRIIRERTNVFIEHVYANMFMENAFKAHFLYTVRNTNILQQSSKNRTKKLLRR